MISKFNKSQFKLMRPRKAYLGATHNFDNDQIKAKAKELVRVYPSLTRQAVFAKAREMFGKTKPKPVNMVEVKEARQESIKSLAISYIRHGMSNRQAYRQAYKQLAVS